MDYNWSTCPTDIKKYIADLQQGIKGLISNNIVGFYLHGSLAMGGFNPKSSDIDILVVTKKPIETKDKRHLAELILNYSNAPFPLEISFLNKEQLRDWQYPCPFDFHYSEFWRERYENDLLHHSYKFINEEINTDTDLAAHITITNHRGICLEGEPINEVFPLVPKSDYVSSIIGDYRECLENIEEDPIYCSLNLIRVYWYLKEEVISSKIEAGNWGLKNLPKELISTVRKVIEIYVGEKTTGSFHKEELISLRNYISKRVLELLN